MQGLNNDRDTERKIQQFESLHTCCHKTLPIYGASGSDSYCSKEALSYRFTDLLSYCRMDSQMSEYKSIMARYKNLPIKYPATENDGGQVLKPARRS